MEAPSKGVCQVSTNSGEGCGLQVKAEGDSGM